MAPERDPVASPAGRPPRDPGATAGPVATPADATAPAAADPLATGREARGYARARARDDAVRESLEPLAPGERPRAVTAGALLAAALAVGNLAAAPFVEDRGGGWLPALAFAPVFAVLALGMWRGSYAATLVFEALLALSLVAAFLSLLVASNLAGAVLCIGVMAVCGPLFVALIRPMARLQMQRRPVE